MEYEAQGLTEYRQALELARHKRRSDAQSFRTIAADVRDNDRSHTFTRAEVATGLTLAVEEQELGHEVEVSEAIEYVLVGKYNGAAEVLEALADAIERGDG